MSVTLPFAEVGEYRAAASGEQVMVLPERPRRLGPVSRVLLARLVVAVVVVQAAGAWLFFGTSSHAARAAGLGLVLPGAGFLYDAMPLLFLLTLVLLVVALVLWWGLSAHFAIPLVWLAAAGGAALLAGGPRLWSDRGAQWDWAVWPAYALALVGVGVALWKVERRYRRKLAQIPALNEHLVTATVPSRTTAHRPPDEMDGELLRWCYSFAEQPADGIDGLDWGEQFHGGTQLRYQVNAFSWAMALYAANHLPNAPRRMEAALGAVVEKHTDPRVWRYWRTLNLLGNFDPNPDPIRRDNIMFSAFLGDVINTFEAATGSDRFDRPGSLTFVWQDGRTFEYDHHSIAEAVRRNYDHSRLGFFPCEPGWSFTVCNVMGAQTLRGHDALHGSRHWAEVGPRWQQTLDHEYFTPDGTYAHIRSNHIGVSWDTGEVPTGHYFANGTHRFADILPDHARRARALEVRGAGPKMAALGSLVKDGRLDLELPAEPERHRTRSSSIPPWTKVIGGARMVGDDALAWAAMDASARQCATGERWPQRPVAAASNGLGGYMIVRWSAPLDLAALNIRGYVAPQGPLVDAADQVLIAMARSGDGRSLDVVVEPMAEPLAAASLRFANLATGASYRLVGEGRSVDVHPSADGTAVADIGGLSGRTALRLEMAP